jgi:D-alanyl-lipoteichoic acid acyltransferase DltB (MBOAT superfamily)
MSYFYNNFAGVNTLVTFGISGLWHGADWGYVIWGLLNGAYIVIEKRIKSLFGIKKTEKAHKRSVIGTLVTFVLISFSWIFFRADSISVAFSYIGRLFTKINPWALTNGTIYNIGLSRQEMNILLISVAVLFFVDFMKRRKNIRFENITDKENFWVRGAVIFILLFVVIIFGAYGHSFDAQEFIYFQF